MMQHAVYIIELLILTVTKHVGCQCRFFFRFHIPIFVEFTDDITRFWSSIKQSICCILFRRSNSYIIEISASAADPLSYDLLVYIMLFFRFMQTISLNSFLTT